jgi:plasmid stabilization system protein ParE
VARGQAANSPDPCPALKPARFTPTAESDVRKAYVWYESQKEGLGIEFLVRVDQAVEIIGMHPESHPRIFGEVRRAPMRQFPFNIWYRVLPDDSVVIGCLHGKRDTVLARERAAGVLEMPDPS